MKNLILVSLILVSFSFSRNTKRLKAPPGTVQIAESFFADATEVSNFSWQEYVHWIRNFYGENSEEYRASLPDTLVWMRSGIKSEMHSNIYFWHPAFRDYPVVGISYEQAQAFCK